MKKLLIILVIFFSIKHIHSNNDLVNIKNFGIISIGNGYEYLGKHNWKLSFKIKDSLHLFEINSKENQKFIYFNLSKNLSSNQLNYLAEITVEYIVKKNNKNIFLKEHLMSFQPQNLFVILRMENKEKLNTKGKVLDSYAVEYQGDYYYLVRSILDNKLLCWYVIKNSKIVNIHTEFSNVNHQKIGRITVTNFKNDQPEFTFEYLNNLNKKIITLGENFKLISLINSKKTVIPKITKNIKYLEYRGYIYNQQKNNG